MHIDISLYKDIAAYATFVYVLGTRHVNVRGV